MDSSGVEAIGKKINWEKEEREKVGNVRKIESEV